MTIVPASIQATQGKEKKTALTDFPNRQNAMKPRVFKGCWPERPQTQFEEKQDTIMKKINLIVAYLCKK
jgi:hypothetical protein